MSRALSQFQIVGVQSNVEFLKRLISTPSFSEAKLDTGLIEREKENLVSVDPDKPEAACLLAALAALLREGKACKASEGKYSPWALCDGWRVNGTLRRKLEFLRKGNVCAVTVEYLSDGYHMQIEERDFEIRGDADLDGEVTATINGVRMHATVVETRGVFHVFLNQQTYVYKLLDPLAFDEGEGAHENSLLAPMPCLVRMLLVEPGELVERGAPLLVVEAMKMEYTIKAPGEGRVQSFLFAVGDQVPEGTQLLRFERAPEIAS